MYNDWVNFLNNIGIKILKIFIKIKGKEPIFPQEPEYEPLDIGHTDEMLEGYLMDLDQKQNETNKSHEEQIKALLKKEPKIKDEIKKIIVDQLVKAKIKTEQYSELSAETDKFHKQWGKRASRKK